MGPPSRSEARRDRPATAMKRLAAATAVVALVAVGATAAVVPARLGLAPRRAAASSVSATRAALAGMALRFEPNRGQTDPSVRFLAHSGGGNVYLTDTEAVFALAPPPGQATGEAVRPAVKPSVVRMHVVGARRVRPEAGPSRLPGLSNYLIGNDPAKWHRRVPAYSRVEYRDVYPGIDLVYHGEKGPLEYDFEVAPGGEPDLIRLAFEGQRGLSVDAGGDLVMSTPTGPLRQKVPVAYQHRGGERRSVEARYTMDSLGRVGFHVGAYDPTRPLVIDPVLEYSTYLGGQEQDAATAVAVDASGSAYVTGFTYSADFPLKDPVDATNSGGSGSSDAFVSKLSPDGSALVYSTYLGGGISPSPYECTNRVTADYGRAIAVDASGSAYVAGDTNSVDFPTTPTAYQPVAGGATCVAAFDTFVTRLDPTGSRLMYSSYLFGLLSEFIHGIAVDGAGGVYVVGSTASSEFPTTANRYKACGQAWDVFVTKFDTTAVGPASLSYSTCFGSKQEDKGMGVALSKDGDGTTFVNVTGYTLASLNGANFPITPGAYRTAGTAFAAKIDPSMSGNASRWIRAIRDALGMSGDELAARMGVTQSTVVDLENSELHEGSKSPRYAGPPRRSIASSSTSSSRAQASRTPFDPRHRARRWSTSTPWRTATDSKTRWSARPTPRRSWTSWHGVLLTGEACGPKGDRFGRPDRRRPNRALRRGPPRLDPDIHLDARDLFDAE